MYHVLELCNFRTGGPSAHLFYKYIVKRVVDTSGDRKSDYYLDQRLSSAIQRGNAASLIGTIPRDSDEDYFFDAKKI